MKKNILFVTCILISQFVISQTTSDKKCKEIYADYREKDSLLNLSTVKSDSLLAANKILQLEATELRLQLANLKRELAIYEYESKLIKIGNQKWDSDNLKVTTLNDGTPIFFADTRSKWDSLFSIGEPAYCFHREDPLGNYGYIYNYFAIETGKLAPLGMKIPSQSDIAEMMKFIATEDEKSAALLKSSDTTNMYSLTWKIKGSDRYGLHIKPYGFRLDDSKEWYSGNKIYYWCQNKEPNKIELFAITEINDDPFLLEKAIEAKNSNYGLFVRCIKQ
jgi:uncharacterized protein (TIGR02145 family)